MAYLEFILTCKDKLPHTLRQTTIDNLYTYNSLKNNAYEFIKMASRYTALAKKKWQFYWQHAKFKA